MLEKIELNLCRRGYLLPPCAVVL